MSVTWTKEQEEVISVRNKNILVSAAAGSGKTAVLVERIVSMLKEPESKMEIDRLLVVTFTNAAATEMRERIGQNLEKCLEKDPNNQKIQRQSALLPNAQICTIDSFCLYVIRNYFHQLDIDPAFRIGDDGELTLLKNDVLQELLERKYKEKDPRFLEFIETYAPGKSDKVVEEYILKISRYANSFPYPKKWLADCKKMYEKQEQYSFIELLLPLTKQLLLDMEESLKKGCEICQSELGPFHYEETLRKDLELIQSWDTCDTYEDYYKGFQNIKFATLSRKRPEDVLDEKKEQVKELRDGVKKGIGELKERYFSKPLEEVLDLLEKSAPVTFELLDLCEAFLEEFQEKKKKKNLVDFSDLEHFALEILVEDVDFLETGIQIKRTAAARELAEYFEEIMIDEYQDSNFLQEIILNSINKEEEGRGNVFQVGDVKQSIYQFRMARPDLFLGKYHTYGKNGEEKSKRIDLHKNFRSRIEVLEGSNYIFSKLMKPSVGGILYDEDAALYLGGNFPEPENSINKGELLLVDLDQETFEDMENYEAEATCVGKRILELKGKQEIWDHKKECFRQAEYGDIVILLRSLAKAGDVFARILNEMGVPAYTESRTGYFTTIEIQTLLNLLRVVDNKRQDIPLAAVLKSSFGDITEEELAKIRIENPKEPFHIACMKYEKEDEIGEKLKTFEKKIEDYRFRSKYLPVHELLFYILEESGYETNMAVQTQGKQRVANIQMLLEKAIAFEKTSYHGVFHFLRYMDRLLSYQEDFGEADIVGGTQNAVRIMTIHKSKGLEFPVVFVSGLGKGFNRQDTRSRMVLHPALGIGVDYLDLETRCKQVTLPKRVLQKQMDLDMLGEELRVLYVALTRAREKLILTGASTKLEKKLEKWKLVGREDGLSFREISTVATYLDWIVPILLREDSPFDVSKIVEASQDMVDFEEQVSQELLKIQLEQADHTTEIQKEYQEFLEERLGFVYPYQEEEQVPAKLTVSEIKKMGLREVLENSEELDTSMYAEIEQTPYIPEFMKEEKEVRGADRGTAYHWILSHMDLSQIKRIQDVENLLKEQVAGGKITKEVAKSIYPYDIFSFVKSEIGIRMEKAKQRGELYLEQPFVIQVQAKEIEGLFESEEPVLIQGIIDVYFYEEGELVLLDYKTDRVASSQELIDRYEKQLYYYKQALTQLTGKKVKETLIYSFALKEEITIEEKQDAD